MASDLFQILNGPSREALFDALRLVQQEDRFVEFEYLLPNNMREKNEFKILAIEAISTDWDPPEGGHMWMVKAIDPHSDAQGDRMIAIKYNTQSGTGMITFCARDVVGPSHLTTDHRLREGLFVVVLLKHSGYAFINFYVGPFEDSQKRTLFLKNLKDKIGEYMGFDVCNVIPEAATNVVTSDQFTWDMFGHFVDPENPTPDEDDSDETF